MEKIFQKINSSEKGDCMRASICSLLNIKNDESIENFKEAGCYWFPHICDFFKSNGYLFHLVIDNYKYNYIRNHKFFEEKNISILNPKWNLIKDEKFNVHNGFYLASVLSPKYFEYGNNKSHMIVIDKNFNIIHDPNPEYQNILNYPLYKILDYNGIIDYWLFTKIEK